MTDQNRKILVLGALSAMARESARVQAGKGASLYLVGRDGEALRAEADDLRVRGAGLFHLIYAQIYVIGVQTSLNILIFL